MDTIRTNCVIFECHSPLTSFPLQTHSYVASRFQDISSGYERALKVVKHSSNILVMNCTPLNDKNTLSDLDSEPQIYHHWMLSSPQKVRLGQQLPWWGLGSRNPKSCTQKGIEPQQYLEEKILGLEEHGNMPTDIWAFCSGEWEQKTHTEESATILGAILGNEGPIMCLHTCPCFFNLIHQDPRVLCIHKGWVPCNYFYAWTWRERGENPKALSDTKSIKKVLQHRRKFPVSLNF